MRLPTYLVKSKTGVFHFRLMVPLAHRQALGRAVFKRSLRTRDPQKAQLLALALAVRYAQALGNMGGIMDEDDILKSFLLRDSKSRSSFPSLTGQRPKIGARLNIDIGPETGPGQRIGKFEAVLPNGITIRTQNDSPQEHESALEALEMALKYVQSQQPTPAPSAVAPSGPKKPLDEAATDWLAEVQVDAPNPKTLGQKRLSVNGFSNWKGPSTDIATLTPKDFSEFAQHLKNDEKLALPTINNRMIYIRQWMAWAQRMGYYPAGSNPAQGVAKFSQKEKAKRARKNGWQAFTDEQIRKIFDPRNIAEKCPKPLSTRWCLVLSLYTGARISELAQLALRDITEKEGRIWITVDTVETGQSVKSESSLRTIPLHPDIKALGLLERVEALKKQGATMLFPDLKAGQNGYGGAPSKGITRYLDALDIKPRGDGRVGAHSFRNCIIQHFDAVGVPDSASRLYTGHRIELDAHEINYKTETKIHRADLLGVLKHLPKAEWGIKVEQIKPLLMGQP